MKKIAFVLLLIVSASSHGLSQNVVENLATKVSTSCVSFDYSYVIKMQFSMKGSGRVTVQGDTFRMEGDGLVICCDGDTRWIADEQAKELVIETVQEAGDFMVNPALLVGALDSAFDLSYDEGEGSYVLRPKVGTGLQLLRLRFKGEKLIGASMTLADGVVADFAISNMKFSSVREVSSFSYPVSSLNSSWVITDLR